MRTIRLRINDNVYKHFIWFLQRFKRDEIQVVQEDESYNSVKAYLAKELDNLEKGDAELISLEELEN